MLNPVYVFSGVVQSTVNSLILPKTGPFPMSVMKSRTLSSSPSTYSSTVPSERFLTQPFFATQQFTGMAGRFVSLDETLDGCEALLSGELSHLPESAFYMAGGLQDVLERSSGHRPS